MKTSFALLTRQVAKLANVDRSVIHSHHSRHGHWHGVVPRKLPSGRLLWRADEVHKALGLIPDWDDMTPGERAWDSFLSVEGFTATLESFRQGARLMCHEPDHGRDPDYYVDESHLFVEIAEGFCARLRAVFPTMTQRQRERSIALMARVASLVSEFEITDESEASHG